MSVLHHLLYLPDGSSPRTFENGADLTEESTGCHGVEDNWNFVFRHHLYHTLVDEKHLETKTKRRTNNTRFFYKNKVYKNRRLQWQIKNMLRTHQGFLEKD